MFRRQSPSRLSFEPDARDEHPIRSNLRRGYGVVRAPSESALRERLDPVTPARSAGPSKPCWPPCSGARAWSAASGWATLCGQWTARNGAHRSKSRVIRALSRLTAMAARPGIPRGGGRCRGTRHTGRDGRWRRRRSGGRTGRASTRARERPPSGGGSLRTGNGGWGKTRWPRMVRPSGGWRNGIGGLCWGSQGTLGKGVAGSMPPPRPASWRGPGAYQLITLD